MANVKEIVIFGKIPFNCNEHHEMCAILGDLNAPSNGLRITYGKQSMVPNDNGGKTTMYEYSIEGQEAVSDPYIDRMMQAIVDCGGTIEGASVVDIENSEGGKLTKFPKKRSGVFMVTFPVTVPGVDPDSGRFGPLRDYARLLVTTGHRQAVKPHAALFNGLKIDPEKIKVEPA